MSAHIGPVELTVVGDTYVTACRIAGLLWEGATTSGDRVEIRCPTTNAVLWRARTGDSQTYLGAMIPIEGIHCPNGFRLSVLSAGTVLVYLRES